MRYCVGLCVGLLPIFIFSQGLDTSDQEVVDNFKYYTTPGGLYFPSKSHYLPNDLSGSLAVENIVGTTSDKTTRTTNDKNVSLTKSSFSSISQHTNIVSKPVSVKAETPSSHMREFIKSLRDF